MIRGSRRFSHPELTAPQSRPRFMSELALKLAIAIVLGFGMLLAGFHPHRRFAEAYNAVRRAENQLPQIFE